MRVRRIEEGRLSDRGEGLGTVTEKMVQQRAWQIAVIKGRSKKNVLNADLEEARRELRGEDGMYPQPTRAEALPEDQRWEPVPASQGHKAPTLVPYDEQTFAEELYDEGVADAEHDQQIEATRHDIRREKNKW